MKQYKTEQESFWAGKFGNDYISRNKDSKIIASNMAMFSKVLNKTKNVGSIIEFGANIGLNLIALKYLLPDAEISAVEINAKAVAILKKNKAFKVYHKSLFDYSIDHQRDFVLFKGVLIHLNPDILNQAYDVMYNSSNKYICIAEYYNPSPVEVKYRGYDRKLFKRDFPGEIMEKFADLQLIDYGFCYHRDYNFPQDDLTWFLFKK